MTTKKLPSSGQVAKQSAVSGSDLRPRDDPRRTQDLVPHIVDYLSSSQPDGLLAEYPISAFSYEEGYRRITYGEFANAVNGLAHWLKRTLGTPRKEHEILAYMGPNDLRYPALVVAAVKAGFIMFLTSPRNSVAAQETLFQQLDCTTLLSPSRRLPQVKAISDTFAVKVAEVPDVEELLSQKFEHFQYNETYFEALDKPFLVVHTSGSTGFPKPLFYTHRSAPRNTKQMSLDPPEGFVSVQRTFEGKRFFMTFPPFHAAAFVMTLYNCLPFGTIFIAPIAGAIPSAEGLVEGLKKCSADIAFIVPSIILELAQNPDLLDYCAKNLDFIMYCGGDLPQEIGDIVASKIKLVNQFGATELGICALLHRKDHDPKDWRYVQFHPEDGHIFRPSVDDTYELYIIRNEKYEAQQPTFTVFPGITEYGSRDLFVRHPTKPNMWRWKARADDIIVFLNGEKTNPVSMEQHIVARNPEITAALVIGAQRFQAAILLEVNMGQELSLEERAAAIERFWPSIEEANHECPTHAKIAKTHILFVSSSKPLIRTGKGTIPRSGNLHQYASEIDELYANADQVSSLPDNETEDSVDLNDASAVLQYIRKVVSITTEWKISDDDENFFHFGMDSLQGLVTVRRLRRGLNLPDLALSTVYTHPTVNSLALAIFDLSYHRVVSKERKTEVLVAERQTALEKFKSLIKPSSSTCSTKMDRANQVVILTGSTGTLGSYILAKLLSDPSVSHIYCLNRSIESIHLQIKRNTSLHLSTEFPQKRVTFLTVNLAITAFDLPLQTYDKLLATTTLIIHSAWPVNFNMPLSAFEPSIHGLVSLINFAGSSKLNPHLHFISSISSVMSFSNSDTSHVPETIFLSSSRPLVNAYAESKHISELLLDYTQSKFKLSLSFSRVGQIAGAVDAPGLWNRAEWFPSLVLSSFHIGALPESLGHLDRIDWIPIDKLAEIIIEIASTEALKTSKELSVFHLVHPHATTWSILRPWVHAALEDITEHHIKLIPTRDWINLVRKDMEVGVSTGRAEVSSEKLANMLNKNPAAKLIDFYQGVMGLKEDDDGQTSVVLDTEKTLRRSENMRSLELLEEEWIRKWIREWTTDVGVSP